MADNVLREFLVSLGFQVKKSEEQNFTKALEGATLRAKLLGDALEGAARKLVDSVASMAKSMEALYYQSERTRTSAKDLQAFGFAASQMGSSVEEANAAVNGFSASLRQNRGMYQFLTGQGVKLTDSTGKQRDNLALMKDYWAALDKMPLDRAEIYFKQFEGGSENLFLAYRQRRKEFEEWEAKDKAKNVAFGFDPQKAAADAKQFDNSLRDLQGTIGKIGQSFLSKFMQSFGKDLDSFNQKLVDKGPQISETLAKIADAIVRIANAIADWLANPETKKHIDDFTDWIVKGGLDHVLDNWGVAATALAAVLSLTLLPALMKVASTFGTLVALNPPAWLLALMGVTVAEGAYLWNHPINDPETKAKRERALDRQMEQRQPGGEQESLVSRAWGWLTGRKSATGGATLGDAASRGGPGPGNATAVPREMHGRAMALMDRLVKVHGWTPEAAAIAAGNAQQESSVQSDGRPGDGGRSWGMFQWNGDRLAGLKAFAAKRNASWQDFNTQVDYFAQETQNRSALERGWKGVTDLRNAGAIGYRFEGYGDNSTGTRVRNSANMLAAYKSHATGSTSVAEKVGSAVKKFGDAVVGKANAATSVIQGSSFAGAGGGLSPATLSPGFTQPRLNVPAPSQSTSSTTVHAPQNVTINGVRAEDAGALSDSVNRWLDRNAETHIRNLQGAVQ